ncbi:transcription factor MYC1 [Raphanus sativus]|uniref:Transcription factor MYC1 n=1 Tax=Raphanus sativus TaxID=3726 RepID=A0A6J0L7D9_RAPSA|nr:transcription factor MYC1 [Raphanus sativus]
MSLAIMADGVETERGGSKRKNSLLRKQLAVALRSVQWSYAIFWSSSPTQSGVLEWEEGCYNGDIKKRKKRYEAAHYKYALQRSNQLRKLYLCMLEGDSNTTISTTHDVNDHGDDEEHNCNGTTSMMLSPDDLSDEEWYYLVSMSYVFSPSQCLPGRALATGETIWLCNAQYADNKLFSRSLLARSASIQTVVCFPYLGGVIELGVTELISEDHSLLQHVKFCLLETSKPDCVSLNFSAHHDSDDEKDQMKIKISDANSNSLLQENHQIQFGTSDEDVHYKRTVSTLLKYAAYKNVHHLQPDQVSSNTGSSFLRWKQREQPNSILLQEQSNFQPSSQNVLRKILQDVPLMHSLDTKRMSPSKMFGLNQDDDPWDRSKENEKFSVLRAMVPTVNEVDKESILNNTIKYLQELEERVEELESCMGSVNFVERQRKSANVNDSVLIEETSGNYDNSTKIDGNSGETEKVTIFRDETHLRVKLKETEVMMEVRCSYRDYIVADIMETLSKLHMDAFSVRSHTLNGFLTLNLKAKFRGAAVASVGMIKRELRRIIGAII